MRDCVLGMVILILGVVASSVLLVALLRGAAYNEKSSEKEYEKFKKDYIDKKNKKDDL